MIQSDIQTVIEVLERHQGIIQWARIGEQDTVECTCGELHVTTTSGAVYKEFGKHRAEVVVAALKAQHRIRFVIEAQASLDAEGHHRVLSPIGPFDTREEAIRYMDSLQPLWGTWSNVPLYPPTKMETLTVEDAN